MENRTTHVIRNLNMSAIYQVVNIIIKFVLRTIFIKYLGKEYLGLNGVFSNILTVLSLSELGLGTAIVYDMYKPIHDKDNTRIAQLFKFYKYMYAVIGAFILGVGMLLIPALKYIITDIEGVSNIYLIYILQLVTTAASYFFAQYRSLIDANQLNELNTKNNIIFNILKTIFQAIALIVFQNYILYLLTDLIVQVLSNYSISRKCKKMFPYIKTKVENISFNYIKKLLRNASSMFSIKIGSTVLTATDNLIISSMISTVLTGIYSNYTMITSVITASTMLISTALQASVGNLCVASDKEKKIEVFEKIRFLYSSIYAMIFVCFFILGNDFITIWIGKDYLLSPLTVFFIILNCYLTGVRQPIEIYIYADGLFNRFKIKPWIEAGINLIVSLILVNYWGIIGVLVGTTISHITTTLWYDAYVVYKYSLKEKLSTFFKKYFDYFLTTLLIMGISYIATGFIRLSNIYVSFIIKAIVCLGIFIFLWYIRYNKAQQLIYYKNQTFIHTYISLY